MRWVVWLGLFVGVLVADAPAAEASCGGISGLAGGDIVGDHCPQSRPAYRLPTQPVPSTPDIDYQALSAATAVAPFILELGGSLLDGLLSGDDTGPSVDTQQQDRKRAAAARKQACTTDVYRWIDQYKAQGLRVYRPVRQGVVSLISQCSEYYNLRKFVADIDREYNAVRARVDRENDDGNQLYESRRFDRAVEQYRKALQLAESIGVNADVVRQNLANAERQKGAAEVIAEISARSQALNLEGNHLYGADLYSQAIEKYQQALELARGTNNDQLLNTIANNLKRAETARGQMMADRENARQERIVAAEAAEKERQRQLAEAAEQARQQELARAVEEERKRQADEQTRQERLAAQLAEQRRQEELAEAAKIDADAASLGFNDPYADPAKASDLGAVAQAASYSGNDPYSGKAAETRLEDCVRHGHNSWSAAKSCITIWKSNYIPVFGGTHSQAMDEVGQVIEDGTRELGAP